MPLATGVAKQVRYKVEATYGTPPGAASAQLLRRVQSTLDLSKDTYQSNEIRDDYQIADFRHGVRKVAGSLNGELSPKTYADFIAAALRRDFAAVSAITALSITIAAGSLLGGMQTYTVTRAAGDFLTGGIKIGDVVRLTAGTFNVNNLNKNLMVVGLTATIATVVALNATALTAEGPIASATLSVVGKKTYVPTSGHTDKSFSVEHWFSDVAQSEVFTGCKVNTVGIKLPATGMATIDVGLVGKDLVTATSQYYTSPTAATATGVVAAVNGVLVVGGVPMAICTGIDLNIEGGYSGEAVVGANTVPNQFPGRVKASGQFTAYFENGTLRDAFLNETEINLIVVMTANNDAAADFIGFTLPRLKLGGASKGDGESAIVATFPFQALFNSAGGTGVNSEKTTLVVQDSQA
jgi:hypothetical protein